MRWCWLAIAVACSHPPTKKDPPPTPRDAAATADAAMTEQIVWTIEAGRVGPAEVGKPLPKPLLVADLGARYRARLIADAVAVDAFGFDDPPLTILVEGPFTTANDEVEGATEKYRAKAVETVRGGVAIETVMITAAGPKTAAGIGVGSTFAEVQQAYDDLKLVTLPPTLGNDRCVGTTKQLPGVAFVFETCAKATAGDRVVRVDVRS